MKRLVSTAVMRQSDRYTIENKVSSKELMRRAGEGVFKSVDWGENTAIVCGSGNNAGDGYVLALYLRENGKKCKIFLIKESFSEDGEFYFKKCAEKGIEYEVIDENESFKDFDTIADCIYGTGFHGDVTGKTKSVIENINKSSAFVVSVDINSGLNGDSGMGRDAVRSDLTVSIGDLKTGHVLNMAKDKIKALKNIDIGIEIIGESFCLLEKEDFVGAIPKRQNFSHKGVYGYSAVMGGCMEYSGAVKLAGMSMASLRAGSGVSRLIVPKSIMAGVSPYLLESTLFGIPDEDGKMIFDPERIDEAFKGIKSAAVGMGWGRCREYEKILGYILEKYEINLVIDADGLNTLAAMDKSVLKNTKCRVCLTPHLKEFERLSGFTREEIEANGIGCAKSFAKDYGVVLLLKGTATIVTDGENVFVTNHGCPGMATAGSGDVLSGILAGIFGYMDVSAKSAALGAYIAGRAGELAEEEIGSVGMTASDTAAKTAEAVGELYDATK